jgi:hypothetical protein
MNLLASTGLAPAGAAGVSSGGWGAARLAVLVLLGAAVLHRAVLALTLDFPINDGALFLEFVRSAAATFPALPASVTFNGLGIPFAYPPLAFWMAGGLTQMGADPLEIVRVAPLLMNILYLGLFTWLLYRLGVPELVIAITLFFFITNFRSFEWLIMGGGLARQLGALSMVGALLILSCRSPHPGRLQILRLAAAGGCVAAAVLSHPQWGILAAAAAIAMLAVQGGGIRIFIIRSLIVGLTAVAITIPWIAHILSTHGSGPFAAAAATGEHSAMPSTIISFVKAVLINPFIAIGAAALLLRRDYFWLLFLLAAIVLTPRLAPSAWSLPIAVFAAQGAVTTARLLRAKIGFGTAVAATAALALVIVGVRIERDLRLSSPVYRPLDPDLRAGMAWVAAHRPGEAFAVLTEAPWYYDASAEWFPVLASATSTTTVQGREWLPNREFGRWFDMSEALKADERCAGLLQKIRGFGRASYVWAETHRRCFAAAGQQPLYENEDVAIYALDP